MNRLLAQVLFSKYGAHLPLNRQSAIYAREGIDLDVTVAKDPGRPRIVLQGGYDVAEFYSGLYIADLAYKTFGYTAIPIFVKRMFRHSYIYINTKRGITKPADLNGRRVGLQTWITSAALWAKGILEEEHGVDLSSITWVAWQPVRIADWQPPPWLKMEIAPAGSDQYDLLAAGEIDGASRLFEKLGDRFEAAAGAALIRGLSDLWSAREAWQDCVRRFPDRLDGFLRLVSTLLDLRRFEEADDVAHHAKLVWPRAARAWSWRSSRRCEISSAPSRRR